MHHLQTFKDNPFSFTMRRVEGGTFDMGNDAFYEESPVHSVTVENFWMGEYPVTQALWAIIMYDTNRPDPPYFIGENHPVEQVSWEDITHFFLPELNEMTKDLRPKGSFYRLPTEAEWEFAAKGGKDWANVPFKYAGSNKLNEVGWCSESSHKETKPVGLKTPNFLGLYDMSGNVYEWCEDQGHSNYKNAPNDGSAWFDEEVDSSCVLRGGNWSFFAWTCLSTHRYFTPSLYRGGIIGFRLVLAYPTC